MNLDLYSTLTLLQAVDKVMPVNTFLRSTFFPGNDTFVTEHVMVDFRKGRRKMAPFVAPRSKGVTIDREGYRTDTYTPPKVAPQRPITVDDLMLRGMGESIMSQRTPADRQAELLGKDLADFTALIDRREEWMAAQLLCNGTITMYGYSDALNKNIEVNTLDYQFSNKVTLTGSAAWGQSTASIYQNLWDWRLATTQSSGKAPTMAIFGKNAATAFINDADIQKKMSLYHAPLVPLNPEVKSDALTFLGNIPQLGLDLVTYSDFYIDDTTGTEKPFIPDNAVILARPNLGGFRYGAVTQLENGQFVTIEGKRVPKSWADEDAEARMLRVSSRPVPVPEDVADWLVAVVM